MKKEAALSSSTLKCNVILPSSFPGIREPVGGGAEAGVRLGLGKQEQDSFYTAADNIQRKRLETEIQAQEDDARAAMREVCILSCISTQFKLPISRCCNVQDVGANRKVCKKDLQVADERHL